MKKFEQSEATKKKLVELGWLDGQGQSLTWKYWQYFWTKKERATPNERI